MAGRLSHKCGHGVYKGDNVIERRGYPGTIHRIACKTQFNNVNVIRLDAGSRACRFKRVTSYDRRKFTLLHDRPPLPPPPPAPSRRPVNYANTEGIRCLPRQPFSSFPIFQPGSLTAGSFSSSFHPCPAKQRNAFRVVIGETRSSKYGGERRATLVSCSLSRFAK